MNTQLRQPGYLIATQKKPNRLQYQLCHHQKQAYRRFRQSWNHLLHDPYLRDGGHYRQRRYSVFQWARGKLTQLPHEPHFQSSHHNRVHGGFNRHFRAWMPTTVRNPVFKNIIDWSLQQINTHFAQNWRIQAHQFRIEASHNFSGKPTPEGVHKDGADYILIMLVNRHNIEGGTTCIYNNQRQAIARHTLEQSGDLFLINDHMVYHGVTPVTPSDQTQDAWRDVMVLTFHRS